MVRLDKKMKVCLVITNLTGGGAERATIDLANALFLNGHQVVILLLEEAIDYKIPGHLTVEVVQRKGLYLHGFIGKRFLARKLAKKWHELHKKFNFDLNISRLPFANEVVNIANLPDFFFLIDTNLSEEIKKIAQTDQLKSFRIKMRYKRLYKNNHLIAVSQNVANDLSKNFKPAKVYQIYNPIDIEKIKEESTFNNSALPKLPYVLHIGRAINAKRHDLLLDAWSRIKTKHRLVLITDETIRIKAMVRNFSLEEKVDVVGFQTNPYIWIANADLLVLCSDFEGFGLVLIESLVCKTPIVSTNFGAAQHEIFDNTNISLVPRGNKFKLAKAIIAQLDKKNKVFPKINIERFSFENITANYELLSRQKSALFLKAKNIGDSIILTSSINALPDKYKWVDVICFKESEDIFKMHPRVRNIFVIPRHLHGISKLKAYFEIAKKLSSLRYDLLIQFSQDWRGAFIARLKKIPLKITQESDRRGSFWHNSFNIIAPLKSRYYPSVHQDINILKAANLFTEIQPPKYTLEVSPKAQKKAKRWINSNLNLAHKKIVLIHAAARWSFKQIPAETWVEVINHLHQKYKINVVLNGSENDFLLNRSIAKKCDIEPVILKAKSITESAAIMQQVDLVLSIDSMAIHMASALNKKVICIFGPTDSRNWAPWNAKHKIITINKKYSSAYLCQPCGRDGCNGSKVSDCLINLPAEMIIEKINGMLLN